MTSEYDKITILMFESISYTIQLHNIALNLILEYYKNGITQYKFPINDSVNKIIDNGYNNFIELIELICEYPQYRIYDDVKNDANTFVDLINKFYILSRKQNEKIEQIKHLMNQCYISRRYNHERTNNSCY